MRAGDGQIRRRRGQCCRKWAERRAIEAFHIPGYRRYRGYGAACISEWIIERPNPEVTRWDGRHVGEKVVACGRHKEKGTVCRRVTSGGKLPGVSSGHRERPARGGLRVDIQGERSRGCTAVRKGAAAEVPRHVRGGKCRGKRESEQTTDRTRHRLQGCHRALNIFERERS